MAQVGEDCYFFYYSSCTKGTACPFRHVEEARANEVTCTEWQLGRCRTVSCPFRHMELQKNRTQTPCYYETQPGGCSKQLCPFMHKFPRTTAISTSVVSQPPPLSGPPSVHPQNTWVPPPGMPPRNRVPPHHTMWSAPARPHTAGTMFPPRGAPVPPFPHYLPRPPQEVPYTLDQSGDVNMLQVDPVIISLNSEESDQESHKSASPVKAVSRTVVPTGTAAASNPLDYFLNAKRWVDPNPKRQDPLRQYDSNPSRLYSRRSPSPPPRHSSPYRRRNSKSPETRSPRGSPVPDGPSRRRSVSVERTDREPARRRSHSLDRSRSQSPDWRDRRRFGRRSRSPQRQSSRSPVRGRLDGRGRGRDLRNRLPVKRAPVLEEVKVTGSKIVSTKKDIKKEEDGEKKEVDEKSKESEKVPFVEEEVKSLEEIYRERALLSMMEAKKKKIIENKRKRWESVKGEQKKSESEKSDKSESEKQTADEKTNRDEDTEEEKTEKEEDSSNDSAAESDIDLADDVDVEIDAGELDSAGEQSDKASGSESEGGEAEDRRSSINTGSSGDEEVDAKSRPTRSTVSKIVHQAKPSIKSRLGLKAVDPVTKSFAKGRLGNNTSQIRSVKERLGLKTSDTDRPVRSGIIKLSRPGVDRHEEKSISRMRMNRDMRGVGRSESHKAILMVPQITIKNKIEERKAGIKKRLGLIDDNDRRKRKEGLDEELIKLLKEEDVDLDLSEMDLLTKKEKKKLLKKLLAQQGREDEYDIITGKKRKKRGLKKKRERADRDEDSEGERGISRRINIKSRLGPSPERDKESEESEKEEEKEKDTSHDLESGDEIELEAGDQSDEEKSSEKETEELVSQEDDIEVKEVTLPPADKVVVKAKSQEELRLARVAKAAKLKEALEPKTLDDIRRERAHKRSHPGRAGDTIRIAAGQKGRRIIMEEEAEPVRKDPAVTVTFGGRNAVMKRKLIRLGDTKPEQNENTKPEVAKTTKTFKRERTIYVPPSLKRIDGSVTVDSEALKKVARPPIGREIVDYGEMFPSKSASTGDLFGKKAQTKVATASTSVKETSVARPVEKSGTRLAMRLQKGPPKIEVKDATVKTFAEIMAEKKRKRLEAQQGSPSKKPYRPIVFEEDSNSAPASTSTQETKLVPDLRDRLSSFEGSTSVTTTLSTSSKSQPSSNPSSVTSSPVKMLKVAKKTTSVDTVASKSDTNKPNRWKRRKPNEISTRTTVSKSEDSIVSKSEEDMLLQSDSYRDEFDRTDSKVPIKEEITHVSPVRKELPSSVVKKPTSPPAAMEEEESLPEPEKKKKMSDSFLDFGDDLLDIEGDDVDLDLDPDHDELMKEINELLA